MANILYKNEVYKIVGVCMEIHRILGYGFLEVVYKDAMELEFWQKGIPFSREQGYGVSYKGTILKHKFVTYFTLFDNIIVEAKASGERISEASIAQTLNYLRTSGTRLGLVINFGKRSLEYNRLVL